MFEEKEKLKSKEVPEKIQGNYPLLEEEIHVMSDYLKSKKRGSTPIFSAKPKKTFPFWLIWVFIGFIFIGFAGLFYFQPELIFSLFIKAPPPIVNQPTLVNQPATINKESVVNEAPINQPINFQVSPEETLKTEIEKDGVVVIRAETYLPEGAIPPGEKLNFTSSLIGENEEEKYKIISQTVFKFSPLINLLKPIKLSIFYQESEIESSWEDDLKIGYFKEGFWIILPTEVDPEKNTLMTTISSFPSSTFAALVLKEKISAKEKEVQEIAPGIILAEDDDNDGLTNEEEKIYQTNKDNPDTDNDSYADGSELINLFSPLQGSGAKLADSGLIKIYTNETFGYTFFYPLSFIVKVMPESEDKEVIISSETGEFFGIVVQENNDLLSIEDWYRKQVKELNKPEIKKTVVNGQEAVWSLDGLTLYIGKGDKIYAFTYNTGGSPKANFKSTYLMMIKSFKFLE